MWAFASDTGSRRRGPWAHNTCSFLMPSTCPALGTGVCCSPHQVPLNWATRDWHWGPAGSRGIRGQVACGQLPWLPCRGWAVSVLQVCSNTGTLLLRVSECGGPLVVLRVHFLGLSPRTSCLTWHPGILALSFLFPVCPLAVSQTPSDVLLDFLLGLQNPATFHLGVSASVAENRKQLSRI